MMRAALFQKTLRYALQHDALRDGYLAQGIDILTRHQAGVDMRQQSGFAKHRRRGFRDI